MELIAHLPLTDINPANTGASNEIFNGYNISTASGGKIGKCVYFNGSNSYIQGNVDLTANMTFSAWVKFNSNTPLHIIDCRHPSNETGYQPMYGGPTYGLQFHSSATGGIIWDNNTCGFTTGVWYHIVLIISNISCTLYINGQLKGSASTPYGTNFGIRPMRIGTRCSGANWLNGYVNDVRVYNKSLTIEEVTALYKCLVLHYNFEDLYTPLDYIEANGTQWIQTGLTYADFSSTKTIRCEMAITTSANTTSKQYSTWIGCQQNLQYLLRLDYGKLLYYAGGSQSYPTTLANNTRYTIEFVANYNTNSSVCKVNGTTYSSTAPYWGSNSVGIMLFASHNGGAPWTSELGEGKLYYCRFYNRDVLVRDFIPVLRQSDGKAGLYDRVNNVFYPNNGTGEFSYNECFPAVNYQNASISGNTVTFSKSSDGWGNSGILAKEPVNKGFVSATVAQNNRYIMIGFAPVNNSYNYTQGYFIYPSNNAHYNIYELGAHIGDFGTYNANDVFRVIYDGSVIRYYKNDSLVREISASGKMYMNITNYNAASATIKDVSFGPLEFVKDCSGNENFATLRTPSAFSRTTDTKLGEYALRTVNGDSNAVIDTKLNPSCITGTGTICLWYKKDSSAFSYNSGHFLVATQKTSGSFLGATQNSTPFCSGDCSYQTFYLDCVANANSNVQDTNWHFYVFTGVNLSAWSSFSLHSHGDASWLYRGNIADFKIFNTNLSLADIKDLYETRMKIDRNGNVYCEKFVKSSGNLQFPTDRGLIKANGVMYSNQAQVSALYEQLEYIQTNPASLNTGVIPDATTKVKVKIMPLLVTGSVLIGNNDSDSNDWRLFNYNSNIYFDLGSGRINGSTFAVNNIYEFELGNFYVKDVATGYIQLSGSQLSSYSTSSPICITSAAQRVYYLKIYKNNELIRDFIPVRRKSDNIVGMLDKVNGVFYTNSGSGSFTAGTSLGTCYLVGADRLYEGMGVAVNPNTHRK